MIESLSKSELLVKKTTQQNLVIQTLGENVVQDDGMMATQKMEVINLKC